MLPYRTHQTSFAPLALVFAIACTDAIPTGPRAEFDASTARGVPVVSLVELPSLGGRTSGAVDISNAGRIVGYSETIGGEMHAVMWVDRQIVDLGTLGGPVGIALGLNESGTIVGSSSNGVYNRAFSWVHDVWTDLGSSYGQSSEARAINARGQIVGTCNDPNAMSALRPCLWTGGTVRDLGTGSAPQGAAMAINNPGLVVGLVIGTRQQAVAWSNGLMQPLAGLGGTGDTQARAVSNNGTIVGFASTAGGQQVAVLWRRVGAAPVALGTLGGAFSSAYDVNEREQVVGVSAPAAGAQRAFLWQRGVMTDLGSLSAGHAAALALNDQGQIVGTSQRADGTERAVLWSVR